MGHGFWFSLLEMLGDTPGHSYNCSKAQDREYLAGYMCLDWEKCKEILDKLAELEAIDAGLWRENIIWSDNFVLRLADLYRRRACLCPQKPTLSRVNDGKNTQSKVNKIKEDKSKEKKEKKTFPADSIEVSLASFFIGILDSRGYEWPKNKKPDVQCWAAEFDKLIRLDGREPERIRAVLTWCQTRGNFWQPNILSPATLRDKWGRLTEDMKNGRKQQQGSPSGPGSGEYIPGAGRKDYGF
jgi:hypothetical protein